MRLDEPGKLLDDLILHSQSDALVGGCVVLVFLAKAKPNQYPQAVGFKGQNRQLVTEKEDLLGTGIADPRELLESSLGLRQRLFDDPSEITAELVEGDLGTLAQLLGALLWHDPAASDFQELLPRRIEDLLGADAHARAGPSSPHAACGHPPDTRRSPRESAPRDRWGSAERPVHRGLEAEQQLLPMR